MVNIHAQVLISIFLFLFLYVHIQDKSTTDDQRSWDSFKTMTPEQTCGSNEHKDRLELRSKPWDTSSVNTPDTSEGDFQTEVWRKNTHLQQTKRQLNPLTYSHSQWSSARCVSKGFCTCLQVLGQNQRWRVLYSIFSHRDITWKSEAWRVW